MLSLLATMSLAVSASLVRVPVASAFPPAGERSVQVVSGVKPEFAFNEVVVSWNLSNADQGAIEVEARGNFGDRSSRWYRLGIWSLSEMTPKQSEDDQADFDAEVFTDTLRFKALASSIDLRVTLTNLSGRQKPELKLLTASFVDRSGTLDPDQAVRSSAWGKVVDVPQRAQGNYPRGSVLCSPTSLSMTLWHWSKVLGRPELNRDVPEVENCVWDPVYKGAGNWPFNTAYAGSFDGMLGYVSRFGSIADLEQWIDAGIPVICSVSFDLLRGLPLSPTESGHLVVLVGFDANGHPILNDPAYSNGVRRTVKRADFEEAWKYSRRTVYVIHPSGAKVPSSSGLWLAGSSNVGLMP